MAGRRGALLTVSPQEMVSPLSFSSSTTSVTISRSSAGGKTASTVLEGILLVSGCGMTQGNTGKMLFLERERKQIGEESVGDERRLVGCVWGSVVHVQSIYTHLASVDTSNTLTSTRGSVSSP